MAAEVTPRLAKILAAQFARTSAEKHEFLRFALDPRDMRTWYVMMHNFAGDGNEFAGGQYLCRMTVTDRYPFDPPRFVMLTPNGVYDVNKEVCVSIGKYHSQNYRAGLGIAGFACQLVSGMIGWKTIGEGISLMHTTEAAKQELAVASHDYNIEHHQDILQLFD